MYDAEMWDDWSDDAFTGKMFLKSRYKDGPGGYFISFVVSHVCVEKYSKISGPINGGLFYHFDCF